MRKFRPSIVVACAGASLLLSAPAAAAQFNFAYSGSAGSGISGNGVITTGEADPSGSFFNPSLLVTSITGVFNGNAITGLLAPGSFFKTSGLFGSPGNDNILYYPSSQSFLGQPTYLDRYGLAFKTSTEQVNLFFGLGGYGSIMQTNRADDVTSDVGGGFAVSPAAAAAVPEPATWAMLMIGFGMVGCAMRRRSRVRTVLSYS